MEFKVRYLALFLLSSVINSFRWFWMSSQEYPTNAGVSQGSILNPTLFLIHINYLPDVICNIPVYADDATLSTLSVIRHLICGNNLNWLLNLNLICKTLWTRAENGLLISMHKKLNQFRLTGLIPLMLKCAIDVKMDRSLLEEKSYFKMLSSNLDWGFHIISIAKTPFQETVDLICSVKFLFPKVALYVYNSNIWPCMKYCCHVWTGAPSCYLELLDKLQKRICRTIGPSLAASLEPLAHRQI